MITVQAISTFFRKAASRLPQRKHQAKAEPEPERLTWIEQAVARNKPTIYRVRWQHGDKAIICRTTDLRIARVKAEEAEQTFYRNLVNDDSIAAFAERTR